MGVRLVNGKKRILVGMSGGVDSAVAAMLLAREGHDVTGATMLVWDGSFQLKETARSACYGPAEARDVESARSAARKIGIPHIVVPLAEEFRRQVVDYFRSEYLCGRTPNPCLRCNQVVKFGLLPEMCRRMGVDFEFFATGHYARVERDSASGIYRLLKGMDRNKDQSYFLCRLTQEQLSTLMLPLGGLTKTEVIGIARAEGLADLVERPESQDFVEADDHTALFRPEEMKPGPIVDVAGRGVGVHRGIAAYTVGQRAGLNVSSSERLYVKEIRAQANTIVVGTREDAETSCCLAVDVNWIAGEPPASKFRCLVRHRYRNAGAMAEVQTRGRREVIILFDEKQFGVAPGQGAVFYDGDAVIGGGWIRSAQA